jgi:glucose-6-phosphate isomerase
MYVDIGNALASEADPGVSRADLAALDERVADAHERIAAERADETFGYAALNLPQHTDPVRIQAAVESVSEAETVLTVGIGGSALGARTITSALAPDRADRHVVLDNVDPDHVHRVVEELDFRRTALNVVSRSGTTAETLANFLVVRKAMTDAGVDWTERTVVTTGPEGPLRDLTDAQELPTLAVPEGVPGRYAALSAVGLVPAAMLDCDVEGLLDGAAEAAKGLAPSLFDCPAYAYGAVSYALEERGATVNACMPYAEALEPFAEWFAQLWAESLGKGGRGQAPMRALGATDQHSQLQRFRAGRRDTLVTVVDVDQRREVAVPAAPAEDLEYLAGTSLGDLLSAERRATEASLAVDGRPNVRIGLDRLDAPELGRLLYTFEAACVLAGELADLNPFDQPAVEWGKRAARALLAGEGTAETRAIADGTDLRVE